MQNLLRRWIICLVDLHCSLNALHEAKENGQGKNQSSDPKGVPLNTISPIVPPFKQIARLRLVKDLFEDYKPVMPELEMFNLALIRP
jgi:hypothetical protein